MTSLQVAAILASLIGHLRERGSWNGETHIQKAAFLLENVSKVPMGLEFVLYKHGPYSFDLSDQLDQMKCIGLLKLMPRPYPYGPSIIEQDGAGTVKKMYAKTIERYEDHLDFVAKWVDGKGVSELERLTTAVFVINEIGEGSIRAECVARLRMYKPHVDMPGAEAAVDSALQLVREAKELFH